MDLTDRAIGKFRKRLASALCIRQTQTLCIQQTLCRRDDYRQKQSKDSQNSKKMTIGVPIVTALPRL